MERLKKELTVTADFASEITEICTEVSKAQTLLGILDEKFFVADTQCPSDEERAAYNSGCGRLYALIASVSTCIEVINECIEPLVKEV